MKKLLSTIMIISIFFTASLSTGFASSYNEKAVDYLLEKYKITQDRLQLHDGEIFKLEYTAESFWHASYVVFSDSKQKDYYNKDVRPMPEIAPIPVENSVTRPVKSDASSPSSSPEILPIKTVEEGYIYGSIYIHIKTGRILELAEMDKYFATEWEIAEKELDKLRKEAGKLDLYLFLKLKEIAPTEKVKVWIQPSAVISEGIKEQFEALKVKYPDHTDGMIIEELFSYGYGFRAHDLGGSSSSAVSSGNANTTIGAEIKLAVEVPEARIMPIIPNDKYWQSYNEFWQELEKLRLQALEPSIEKLKEYFNDKGIAYNDNDDSISLELTVAQLNEITDLPFVAMIYEDGIFTTMVNEDTKMLRLGEAEIMAFTKSPLENDSNSPTPYIIASVALLLITASFLYRRRSRANRV